ncbi:MAG TPA: hypothetical protein EYM90_07285, partial [Phycisphaerales bacterium]|nr:hypothetical protein [Phycisphaerales bacterium]
MTESKALASKQVILVGWIGTLLIRVVVPAWIIFGALQKALGGTPKSLPRSILDAGSTFGINDHFLLLASLVSIEFFFVAFMLFSPKFAKLSGIVMLGTFLLVLSVEMFGYGNFESCGCFGEKSLSPMAMFAIDFSLLLGILLIKPRPSNGALSKGNRSLLLVIAFTVIAGFFTFNSVLNQKTTDVMLPASWYPKDISTWVGKDIHSIDLFSWVKEWPHDISNGKQYVIFYSLT